MCPLTNRPSWSQAQANSLLLLPKSEEEATSVWIFMLFRNHLHVSYNFNIGIRTFIGWFPNCRSSLTVLVTFMHDRDKLWTVYDNLQLTCDWNLCECNDTEANTTFVDTTRPVMLEATRYATLPLVPQTQGLWCLLLGGLGIVAVRRDGIQVATFVVTVMPIISHIHHGCGSKAS